MENLKFKIGDIVVKPKGYKFDSTIVSVFQTTKGEIRIVAENSDGILHIFNENQLEHREVIEEQKKEERKDNPHHYSNRED